MRLSTFAITALLASLLALPAGAAIKTETVKYDAGGHEFNGFLAYDDASSGKRPGILVAPEWWGLTDYAKHRAEQLAALGYVAFAMDPYGNGKTANDASEAGKLAGALKSNPTELRARANAALDVLKKNPNVDPSKLGAIGYCFGGTTVLELARSGADLKGVVSFHGGLATKQPAVPGNFKPAVLICHGGDDSFESPEEIAAFQDEMRKAGADWEMNIYGGAVHSFTNPESDKRGIKGIAYNAKADKRSWEAMQTFFKEVL